MDYNVLLFIAITLLSLVALIGFLRTKGPGFGPFNTSALLLILVVSFCALLFLGGKLGSELLGHLFFAVVGFAGGLFTSERYVSKKPDGAGSAQSREAGRRA